MNPIWSFEVGVETYWEWIGSSGSVVEEVAVQNDVYDPEAAVRVLLRAPGYLGETLEGTIEVFDSSGNSVVPPEGKPSTTRQVSMTRLGSDPNGPDWNIYVDSENQPFVLTTLDASVAESVFPSDVVALYDPGTKLCANLSEAEKTRIKNSSNQDVVDNQYCSRAYDARIVVPDLSLSENQFNASTGLLDKLELKAESNDLPPESQNLYEWKVRVQYKTPSGKPSAYDSRKSEGCKTAGGDGRVHAWGANATDRLCESSLRDIDSFFVQGNNLLDLAKLLDNNKRTVSGDTFSNTVVSKSLKNKGAVQTFNVGGGEIEAMVRIHYQRTVGGEIKSYKTKFVTFNPANTSDRRLVGRNPADEETSVHVGDAYIDLNRSKIFAKISQLEDSILVGAGDQKKALGAALDGIVCRESDYHHVRTKNGSGASEDTRTGFPLLEKLGGYGLTQLTDPRPSYTQQWNWVENLKEAMRRANTSYSDGSASVASRVQIALNANDANLANKVAYRETLARHNSPSVGYITGADLKRQPHLCRNEVMMSKLNDADDDLYYLSLNQVGVLAELDDFGSSLIDDPACDDFTAFRVAADPLFIGKYSRVVVEGNDPQGSGVSSVSKCIEYPNAGDAPQIDQYTRLKIQTFGRYLRNEEDNSVPEVYTVAETICESEGATAGRIVIGTSLGGIVDIENVGRCRKSSVCYVDAGFNQTQISKRNRCVNTGY